MEKEETLWIPWNGEGERPLTSVLVKVKGGTFQMGDEVGDLEDQRLRSRPVHTVTLTYDYWIGKYAVTFHEYDAFCAATGRKAPDDKGWGRGQRPVIWVSRNDAIGYCNWLSEKEGIAKAYDSNGNLLDRNGNPTTDVAKVEGYRLPTEAEWEYAARGGQKTKGYKYAGSDDLNEVGWYWQNSGDKWLPESDKDYKKKEANNLRTRPVGQKKPNELGLHDMSGNVTERCHDWYDVESYEKGAQTNPTGGKFSRYVPCSRIIRGGDFYFQEKYCRVAARESDSSHFGFRLVRTVV